MLKLATNITFMFNEVPFLERFARAASAGFRAVEFHNPYPFSEDIEAVARSASAARLQIVHFNLPGGDWATGERGIAVHPDRRQAFRRGVERAASIAGRLGCRQLNCPLGYPDRSASREAQWDTLRENLHFAAERLSHSGIMLLIEPLNPITHPGYPITSTAEACRLQDEVDHHNLRLQYDYYQMQRSEGELTETVRGCLDRIGFIQLADNPGRHEPGTGEINFRFLLQDLDRLGFDGYVSLEYAPSRRTEQTLDWIEAYGLSRAA